MVLCLSPLCFLAVSELILHNSGSVKCLLSSPPPLAVLDKDFSFHTSFIPVVTRSKSLQALSKQKSKMKFYFSIKNRDTG